MFLKLVDDVRAAFVDREFTEVEIAEGATARISQANYGAGSANRVAFVPAPSMTFAPPAYIGEGDDGRRQLVNVMFAYEVAVAAYDADSPDRDLAHRHRAFDIFEAVVQEVQRAYYGVHEWTAMRWEDGRKDGRHGAELVATLILNIPLFDTQSEFGTPAPVPGYPKPLVPLTITPDIGDPAGGGILRTISGLGFIGATGGTAGGEALTSFTVVDDNTITCIMPAHAAGVVDVVVALAGDAGDVTLASAYEYYAPPSANRRLRVQSFAGITEVDGAVSAWADQSGNGYHFTQATGAAKPTYEAESLNGRPGVTFDGVDDIMSTTAIYTDIAEWDAYTVYSAFKVLSNNTDHAFSYGNAPVYSDSGGSWGLHIKGTSAPYELRGYHWSNLNVDEHADVSLAVADTAYVSTHHYEGTTLSERVDIGTADTEPSATGTAEGTIRLGKSSDFYAAFANVTIGELIAFNVAHDADTRTKVARYLMAEWGVV